MKIVLGWGSAKERFASSCLRFIQEQRYIALVLFLILPAHFTLARAIFNETYPR